MPSNCFSTSLRGLLRLAALLVALSAVAASGTGCDDGEEITEISTDRLSLTVYNAMRLGLPQTTTSISGMRVTVVDRTTGDIVSRTTIPVVSDRGFGRAPELPFSDDLQVHLEAVGTSDRTLAYGATSGFAVEADGESIQQQLVFMSRVRSVEQLSAVYSGGQVQPSPFVEPAGRAGHTATRIDDGRVVIVGGAVLTSPGTGLDGTRYQSFQSAIEVFDPVSGYFDPARSTDGTAIYLRTPRVGHETLVLPDGRVLIVGGLTADEGGRIVSTDSVELLTPQPDGSFTLTEAPSLSTARAGTASVVRSNGGVLVTGGYTLTSGGTTVPQDTAELLDLEAGLWLEIGPMTSARFDHTATDVGPVVLIIGGSDGQDALASAEIFRTNDQSFVALPDMDEARHSHAAVRLTRDDGRYVMVAGGHPESGSNSVPLFSWEIFDIQQAIWVTPPNTIGLVRARASFDLIEQRDGSLLAAGGLGLAEGSTDQLVSLSSVEVIDPPPENSGLLYSATELVDGLTPGRYETASAVLDNGLVVITGGARFENGGFASYPLSAIYNPGPPGIIAR